MPWLWQAACDACHITLNKNAVVGDQSAMNPGGVRIGTPAMTSRGLKEQDFERVADFLHEVRAHRGALERVLGSAGRVLCFVGAGRCARKRPARALLLFGGVAQVATACLKVQEGSGKQLKDFSRALENHPLLADIRARVEGFAEAFPMPGFTLP